MFTTKLSKSLFTIVIAVIALITVGFAVTSSHEEPYPDYALRHPGGLVIPVASKLGMHNSDYFQRHPELTEPSIPGIGASDYFQRHPELIARAGAPVDMTDYFFRHPGN